MAKKKIPQPIPYERAERNPRQVPANRLEQIENTVNAARERTAAANPKSRIDAIEAQVLRSGQREAGESDDEE
jgi:hypothetical protein